MSQKLGQHTKKIFNLKSRIRNYYVPSTVTSSTSSFLNNNGHSLAHSSELQSSCRLFQSRGSWSDPDKSKSKIDLEKKKKSYYNHVTNIRQYHSPAISCPKTINHSSSQNQWTATIRSASSTTNNNSKEEQKPAKKKKRRVGQKVTALSLTSQKRHGHKITMVTAYDYPSAIHVARSDIDVLLVGDSCAMVELGYETTQPMTLEQMLHHCQAVKRGIDSSNDGKPLLVGDMPLGTYEYDDLDIALRNAYRLVKEGGMDAVKLEGGSAARAKTVQKVVDGGVAVMGHVGLTPQAISVIGGFRAQGRTATRARALLDEALRLQDAGAFTIVLECVPANVARAITETLEVPTIGIGAGNYTSGQVLVYHDMLGMMSHPHHEQFMPKFCKQYAEVGHAITKGLGKFKKEVEEGSFPGEAYSPYIMSDSETQLFEELLEKDALERMEKHEEAAVRLTQADEYEQLKLYGGKDDDDK